MKRLLVFLLLLSLVFACVSCDKQSGQTRTNYQQQSARKISKQFDAAEYYQENYPMVWGYIKKNSSSPYEYIKYYHQVWGNLQKHTGDGINFDTLTRYEQSLVNYPSVGRYIYFANAKTKEYHSTYKCYTLLKSNPVSRDASYAYMYNPCSKCVGD